MTLRQKLLKLGPPARVAVFAVSICACALSPDAYAENPKAVPVALRVSPPIQMSAVPPATVFSINAVLAKLDRSQGRGRDAIRLVSLKSSNTATDAGPALTEVPARGTEPFGLFAFRAPEGLPSRKWRGVESDMIKEEKVLERCMANADSCPSYAAQFLRLINAVKSKSGRAQLDEANRSVNAAIRYVTDFAQYGEADRWSAPLATFATAKGDCEDYAIAKYVALRDAGFPIDDLRVVLVRDRTLRQDHAVLAARLDDRWLILDSLRAELTEDSRVSNFTPILANLRIIDKLGRYGGEEFLLILPDTAKDQAARTLDRLRAIVSEVDWTAISAGMNLTMSAGICSVRQEDSADDILSRADAALCRVRRRHHTPWNRSGQVSRMEMSNEIGSRVR